MISEKIKSRHNERDFYGGESGIRTLGEFPHTAFRVLHLRPLGQLSRSKLNKQLSNFIKKISVCQ